MSLVPISGYLDSQTGGSLLGQLFELNKYPTSFTALMGGLNGNLRIVSQPDFPMAVTDAVETPTLTAGIIELTTQAPSNYENQVQEFNTTEIIKRKFGFSAAALSSTGELASTGLAILPGLEEVNRVNTPEYQASRHMISIQREYELKALNQTYVQGRKSGANLTGRQMGGLLTQITGVNKKDASNAGTAVPLTRLIFEERIRFLVEIGAMGSDGEIFALCDADLRATITELYRSLNTRLTSNTIVNVGVTSIETDWGVIQLVYCPSIPVNTILFTQPAICSPVALPHPKKGILFLEPKASLDDEESWSIYGDLGIDFGPREYHALLVGVAPTV